MNQELLALIRTMGEEEETRCGGDDGKQLALTFICRDTKSWSRLFPYPCTSCLCVSREAQNHSDRAVKFNIQINEAPVFGLRKKNSLLSFHLNTLSKTRTACHPLTTSGPSFFLPHNNSRRLILQPLLRLFCRQLV